jgi:hypothetical protein
VAGDTPGRERTDLDCGRREGRAEVANEAREARASATCEVRARLTTRAGAPADDPVAGAAALSSSPLKPYIAIANLPIKS